LTWGGSAWLYGCALAASQKNCRTGLAGLKTTGYNHASLGLVAQLVEQRIENPCVGGSIPPRATKNSAVHAKRHLRVAFLFYPCVVNLDPTMTTFPPCPACASTLTYEDGSGNYVCPECAHEWPVKAEAAPEAVRVWRDAAGNPLQDGDSVTVIKDLKLKGGGGVVKQGTKVKNIRLVEGDHDIDCKIDGFGAMSLKSEFVRKS
jgi:protein PhnA